MDTKPKPRLSRVQHELLREFQDAEYGDRYVLPSSRRSALVLAYHGYLVERSAHWFQITDAGRNAS